MGKKSVKENKTAYHISREKMGFSREQAEEATSISRDRIARIEGEKTIPQPDEIYQMSKAYNDPSLCNYYCSQICRIGQATVPKIQLKDLSQITLEMLASLNALNKEKERLIEITVDGVISEDEMADFKRIEEHLEQISMAVDSLQLWVKQSIAEGKIL